MFLQGFCSELLCQEPDIASPEDILNSYSSQLDANVVPCQETTETRRRRFCSWESAESLKRVQNKVKGDTMDIK